MVFVAAVCWGTTATLARVVFRDNGVPALAVVEVRLVIAATILFLWVLARHRAALRVARTDIGYFIVLGLLGVAAVQGTYYHSIARLGVGPAILLQYLAPALIVMWNLARGQRPTWTMVVAVVLALSGTAFLVSGADVGRLRASAVDWAIGLSSAAIFAFYVVYSKRGLRRYSAETVLLYTFTIAALFWAFVTPPWKIIGAGYSTGVWLRLVVLGVFSTLVPFRCFYAGLRRLPPSEAGLIATSEPVVAIVAAALLLGETLSAPQMFGAGMVIAAALLATRGQPAEIDQNIEPKPKSTPAMGTLTSGPTLP